MGPLLARTPHSQQNWSQTPAPKLSPHLHLNPPARSSPISWASQGPPSFHTSRKQKYSGRALSPSHKEQFQCILQRYIFKIQLSGVQVSHVCESPSRPAGEPSWLLISPAGSGLRISGKPSPGKTRRDTSRQAGLKITSGRFPLEELRRDSGSGESQAWPIVQAPSLAFATFPSLKSGPSIHLINQLAATPSAESRANAHSAKQEATDSAKAPTLLPTPTPLCMWHFGAREIDSLL